VSCSHCASCDERGAYAQQSASSGIAGDVTDSSKAAVPGATVTVINVGTNAQRVATTDANGRFQFRNLIPATYEIKVELSGFTTVDIKTFELRQGEIARPTLTLNVATVSETVTVTGQSALLQRRARRSPRPSHRSRSKICLS
jgi:hypothetical protein